MHQKNILQPRTNLFPKQWVYLCTQIQEFCGARPPTITSTALMWYTSSYLKSCHWTMWLLYRFHCEMWRKIPTCSPTHMSFAVYECMKQRNCYTCEKKVPCSWFCQVKNHIEHEISLVWPKSSSNKNTCSLCSSHAKGLLLWRVHANLNKFRFIIVDNYRTWLLWKFDTLLFREKHIDEILKIM